MFVWIICVCVWGEEGDWGVEGWWGVGPKIGTFTSSFTGILTSKFRILFSSTLCSSRKAASKSKLPLGS